MMVDNEPSCQEDEDDFAELIASINSLHLQELVLATRRNLFACDAADLFCTVSPTPRVGSFNIVYRASFSDGVEWAVRIPADDVFSPSRIRALYLDIVSHRFISSKTSIPIPKIHDWSLDDNSLSRPYVIMDYLPGTNLSKVWNDKYWITDSKRQRIFEQIAGWMTELSVFEFGQIGRLDFDSTSGEHHVVQFPDFSALLTDPQNEDKGAEPTPAGPFGTSHSFLSSLLSARRRTSDCSMLAVIQLFLSALPDATLDGPPFVLFHPDLDSQNLLVDDDGTITGIIDWDGVYVGPRQGAAAAYPSWLTVDWDPLFYGWSEDASPEANSNYDSPSELASYRKAYLDEIHRSSAGKLTHITRNSHVWTTLQIAICNSIATSGITDHLSKFVFGSSLLGYEVQEGIEKGGWFTLQQQPEAIAEVLDNFDIAGSEEESV